MIWWQNPGDDSTDWTQRVVPDGSFANIAVADLDGDRDLDLLGGRQDGFGWWENRPGSHCLPGRFDAGDRVALTAMPALGWEVTGWSGTDDDTSRATSNSATMPDGDHAVTVTYAPVEQAQ